ncbi:phosphate ABC transporter, permease protein PstA [Thiorhodovibrio frisius]|uniref:Phosphate transport system permease protein PstA n=1 Tax=Thiorhodovibrio frisius TaxID=631362 RepID=H8YVM9_9GAMM|nr:phosphate ABC transporter, permease protein PstA [Thiorhodovibrio frisius]WPL23042.1 Phosphate transport system permease protein PstC [Thiorhodovibrio frisius]
MNKLSSNPESEPNAVKDGARRTIDIVNASLKRRHAAEQRFRLLGATAVALGLLFVAILFISIIGNGYTAFQQTYVELPVYFDPELIDPEGRIRAGDLSQEDIHKAMIRVNFLKIARTALTDTFPEVKGRSDKRKLYSLLSPGAPLQLREMVARHPEWIGERREVWLVANDDIDMFMKGRSTPIKRFNSAGRATIATDAQADALQITSSGPDFSIVLDSLHRQLLDKGAKTERLIARLEQSLADTEKRRSTLEARQADSEKADQRIAKLSRDLSDARAQLERLQARTATPADGETLDAEMPSYLVAINGGLVKVESISDREVTGKILRPLTSEAPAPPGTWELLELTNPQGARRLKDQEIAWALSLKDAGALKKRFNSLFFTQGSSREPELAGIGGAFMGSLFTLTLTLLFSFPIAVGTAIYLEEFAPKNRWTDLIEININNLAAVPSIVFGLLGLAVFINFFGVPRSTPLVAAMVLTLMTLPTIIIASRAALKSVPPSIREAALGVGASPLQTQFHHVLPLAMPGMLTGTIIGMAQALGETAPLLMIGMIAFIVDIPGGFTDPSTVLPVQIFLWADSPERGFVERTSAAIMVLLAFLIMMNLLAVLLRRRFERRW